MPITTTLDMVRLVIGDNDSTAPLLVDDEIEYFLSARADNVKLAAADACEALAAKFARRPGSWSADGQSVSNGDRVKNYRALAAQLRSEGSGGLSVVPVTRIDGYSDDLSTRDGAGQTSHPGRVRTGYSDPDRPF